MSEADPVPDVYEIFSNRRARGVPRMPTLVLNEKMDYMGGKDEKAKENAKGQRNNPSIQFLQTFRSFGSTGAEGVAVSIYDDLSASVPSIASKNPHVLAAASYILKKIGDNSLLNRETGRYELNEDNIAQFAEEFRAISGKLKKVLSGSRPAAEQGQDVYRYAVMILNMRS